MAEHQQHRHEGGHRPRPPGDMSGTGPSRDMHTHNSAVLPVLLALAFTRSSGHAAGGRRAVLPDSGPYSRGVGAQPEDRGRALLKGMGWVPGTALGARGAAAGERAERPVAETLPMQTDRRGLGAGGGSGTKRRREGVR